MTTYSISNRISGIDLGRYTAETPKEALDALARDAGYEDHAEACRVTGEDASDLVVTEVAAGHPHTMASWLASSGGIAPADPVTVTVPADPDVDDCLAYAAAKYIAEHPELNGYDLSPRWTDDDRETITLTVPRWSLSAEEIDEMRGKIAVYLDREDAEHIDAVRAMCERLALIEPSLNGATIVVERGDFTAVYGGDELEGAKLLASVRGVIADERGEVES
jgi:hypothetical protein